MPLFLLFLIVPLIEIALFIQVGGFIGLWYTLLIVVLTAILGTYLVRSQGLAVLNQLRGSFEELRDPTEPLAHGAMVLFSGALLLTPGFFTDAVGFALMVPAVRSAVFRYFRSRINIQSVQFGSQSSPAQDETIIDADYEDLDDPGPKGPSGWTRH
ncbi:MAG: FxsA family protein [Boseongicola sp.]